MSASTWDAVPLRAVPGDGTRVEIACGPDEHRVVDESLAALADLPEIYSRGRKIVEIVADDPATRGVTRAGPIARIARPSEDRIRELLSRVAAYIGSEGAEIHPPRYAVRGVMSRPSHPGIRPLVAVVEAPTMRPDGSIITAPGYDPSTGIYLASSLDVAIPDAPTSDDARAAVAALLDPICDFDFCGPAGRSAWLAGVLATVARPLVDGPTPMIIVDASTRGSGKSLLADVASVIATGRPAARMVYSGDDSEIRKLITALALVGDPLIVFDNIVGELGSPALDEALTGTTWRDRILGRSKVTAELPLPMTWWATGNGLTVGADLIRRALLVRLEPRVERPEERSGWRYPRLLAHVREHRAQLLAAALTVVRAYVVAGRPDLGLRPMGSYDAWSDTIRSALVWAGASDPVDTVADLRAADARGDALAAVVEHWPAADGKPITVGELLARASYVGGASAWRAALTEWCPPRAGADLPTARTLGYALRAVRRRVVGGRMLDAAGRSDAGAQWVRVAVGGTP